MLVNNAPSSYSERQRNTSVTAGELHPTSRQLPLTSGAALPGRGHRGRVKTSRLRFSQPSNLRKGRLTRNNIQLEPLSPERRPRAAGGQPLDAPIHAHVRAPAREYLTKAARVSSARRLTCPRSWSPSGRRQTACGACGAFPPSLLLSFPRG